MGKSRKSRRRGYVDLDRFPESDYSNRGAWYHPYSSNPYRGGWDNGVDYYGTSGTSDGLEGFDSGWSGVSKKTQSSSKLSGKMVPSGSDSHDESSSSAPASDSTSPPFDSGNHSEESYGPEECYPPSNEWNPTYPPGYWYPTYPLSHWYPALPPCFWYPPRSYPSYQSSKVDSNVKEIASKSNDDSDEDQLNTFRSAKTLAKVSEGKASEGSKAKGAAKVTKEAKTKFYNSIDSYHVLLHLTESVHFHGNLSIKLLAGSASVLGYKLDVNETVTAHAPVGHSSVSITPNSSNSSKHWKESLSKENKFIREIFHDEELKEIEENFKDSQAILLLTKTSSKQTEFVRKYTDYSEIPRKSRTRNPQTATEFILQCCFSSSNHDHFHADPKWERIKVRQNSQIMVTGGKNVGKSTLVRHLVNQNVKKYGKVLLIDLDVGQSEVFVPQTVSAALLDAPILGMGCFAENVSVKSYIFGDLNVANDPQKYIECVAKLMRDIRVNELCKNIPWLINTMGYTRGVGTEIIIALLRLISPTDVLEITHQSSFENFNFIITTDLVNKWKWGIISDASLPPSLSRNFDTAIFKSMVTDLTTTPTTRFDANPTPSATREISILAHLADILGNNWDLSRESQTVCASMEDIKFFNFTDVDVGNEYTQDIFNANLVYLCKNRGKSDILECLGIGIVRGIDRITKKLYLLPSTRDNLAEVNSLALCGVTVPQKLMLMQHSGVQGKLPYIYTK